ncbi:hypothetical protein Daura_17100 [Dactylosporangium aurantiacum]|uniref:Uncharacterized protein n=1 Tax=Dactylosporangium aurantiacum TaxID=35754 RepID=A0A9Q9IPY7_9ACTN|nr:hypothetical protein [Dactylosporangium aurantiacum]MDG6103224.1 hypothetical protein [Dactylosporangium aurantiacum]UWZ57727.1 hypothetical protein Daura_17100 [Dactylosporangium aurantiacum]
MTSGGLGPLPSLQRWQEQVREAMAEHDPARPRLRWTRRDDFTRWDLHGECPRCGDQTSKLVSGVVVSDAAVEASTLVELMMACACDVEHRPGHRGCGAGHGLYITVPAPGA